MLVNRSKSMISFSPRTRGCSGGAKARAAKQRVFPAHAGMFRLPNGPTERLLYFPRVRGDVPEINVARGIMVPFSPRARECS